VYLKHTYLGFLANSLIPDGEVVITGPFNFAKNAEGHNAGNLFIIYDKKLASFYVKNWQYQAQHSEVIL
jgi:phosphatidylserine/phosphatidylglycerophosphate/cardiolipin synthase-like enzyme